MDGQFSWKRTEDTEIDLADLLKKLCGRWKQIAVCALIFAVILGGYGWLKGRKDTNLAAAVTEEILLTEAEEQEVADAVRLNEEIRSLETYLDSSILMQLDPFHKNKSVMLYRIDHAQRKELPGITESYLNFILNGGAADAMMESGSWQKMDKSCLAEVLAAYQKAYSSPYQVVVDNLSDESIMSESLFYVEITGKNAGAAEEMAQDMQTVLKEYSAKAKERAGSHRLTLVSSEKSMSADSGLQSQQNEKRAQLLSNKTALKAMKDAFSKRQMTAYKETVGAEEEQKEQEATVAEENSVSFIKYILLGVLGGAFVYCGIYSCWYLFSDTVKSAEEMKRLYVFPFYGSISPGGMKAKQNDCERRKTQILNRIRLVCKSQGITKLWAVSELSFDVQEKECLESMAEQMKKWGISLAAVENASADFGIWDEMADDGNVLLVCRTGRTTHRMIDDAMSFYLENGVTVIGAAAFDQNV